mmetsp:Transcript_21460/g.46631  ORF Transcript_21460/g.46631 Transcript_21460/m.46631 type:complete len:921 (-) Transcript_21460:125-2887(-)|eukprot:CAMPEP_0172313436 /NCGR_PEP_ID=MMETSP1058-20130122/20164_1 /TAXON_ID=83371 /ORGANISM="Detonula confervacea, Strain CCMP 353" /LENGTH=920 /DNA_ID=CAMNT_0013027083 /DNA_START=197 /DNA_END=2959 /DNA_ORIENTATION=+
MSTKFYSCSATAPSALLTSGATRLIISYQYEVETSSSGSTVEQIAERVQSAMTQSVADQSGLVDCADGGAVHHPWRRLGGGGYYDDKTSEDGVARGGEENRNEGQGRRLRVGGRGSNSIVGLGSEFPPNTVLDNVLCHGDAEPAATTRVDDPFDSDEREVTPGLAGSVVMGDEVEAVVDEGVDLMVVASTRIDGGEVDVLKTIPRSSANHNDNEDDLSDNLAFNYVSTQSIPMTKSSHTSHNPLLPPQIFQQRSQIRTPSNNINSHPKMPLIQTRSSTKCTVIQGSMVIYTSSTSQQASFENLEGRILAALTETVNTNTLGLSTDDGIVGVRMYNNEAQSLIGKDTSVSQSPGYVTAVKGGLPTSSRENGSGGFEFTTPLAILAGLACFLIVLAGLFVRTTTRKPKRQRLEKDGKNGSEGTPSVCTYHDDEVEMSMADAELDLDDDYSACDMFSVSSAKEVETSMHASTSRKGIFGAKTFGARTPSRKSVVTAASGATEWDSVAPTPIRSSMLGLFATRRRATSHDSEVELDMQSVYDCDDDSIIPVLAGARRTPDNLRADNIVADRTPLAATRDRREARSTPVDLDDDSAYADNLVADIHKPLDDGNYNRSAPATAAPISSFFGSLFSAILPGATDVHKSEAEMDLHRINSNVYHCPVDMDHDETMTDVQTVDPGCMGNPSIANSTLLRFLKAREHSHDSRNCASPHSEVEASLAPFEECLEYSEDEVPKKKGKDKQQPESKHFYGNISTKTDRIILNNRELYDEYNNNQDGDNKSIMSKKLGRLLGKRGGKASSTGGGQEIHEIYSHDEDESRFSRKPPRAPTSNYTMQRKNSTSNSLRPVEFYKSPSAVLASSPPRRKHNNNGQSSTAREEQEDVQQQQRAVANTVEVSEDGGTVAVYTGPLCPGGMTELLSPEGWC